MIRELPHGTIAVVLRRAGVEPARGSTDRKLRLHCIRPEAHKNGDARPSSWADLDKNIVGCPVCGTMTAKATAEALGVDWPAVLDEVMGKRESTTPAPRVRTSPQSTDTTPPRDEVMDIWYRCGAVADDPQLARELGERRIDPATVTDRDLARALPTDGPLPGWARVGRDSWRLLGNRCIVPMFDTRGGIASLHARRLIGDGKVAKGLSPASPKDGPRYTIRGLIFADPMTRMVLANGVPSWWTRKVFIVEEGVPDWLTVATYYGDEENTPAVLGVISGSWNATVAARIPDDARVIIRTHHDAAGEKYAAAIASSLSARCSVVRSQVQP